MKKLILLSAIFSLFATKLVAQENSAPTATSTPTTTQEASDSSQSKKEKREQRYENASPAQKEKMDKRREENKNLSKEERKKKREENRGNYQEKRDSSSGEQEKKDSSKNEDDYKNQPYSKDDDRKGGRNERYENASPEQKIKMDKHREMMRNLPPEKRELVKKEMERHRGEMKKITGFDLPSPGNPDQQNERPE
jgi:hypothetical protein